MRHKKITLITVSVVFILSSCVYSVVFTLSDEGLLQLDCNNDHNYYPKMTAKVIEKRDIDGPGVEFDIKYIGNEPPDNTLHWASTVHKGEGLLTNIDITKFDSFGLEFKLLSINGSVESDIAGPIVVGAMINNETGSFAYQPQTIGLANESSKSAVSKTTTDADVIQTIGFVANIPSWWYNEQNPNPWNPEGSVITLLVKPLDDAVVIQPQNIETPVSDTPAPQIPSFERPDFDNLDSFSVIRVIDKNTILIKQEYREKIVRLIGIDTIETGESAMTVKSYKEASKFTDNLLKGERVYLVNDSERAVVDSYGRRLAYVYRYPDGLFVNAEIVRQGYGQADTRYPFKHTEKFKQLEVFSKNAQKGLWANLPDNPQTEKTEN